jgi:ribonuclease VapC
MTVAPGGYVLDASAVIALLRGEPGAEVVAQRLDGSSVSSVNWSETARRLLDLGTRLSGLAAELQGAGLVILPFSAEDAEEAARLAAPSRNLGLSFADRACLALAKRLDRVALTADRAWLGVDLGVRVEAIR